MRREVGTPVAAHADARLSQEDAMNYRLQQLDSFTAKGSDGATYKVKTFEHQVRDDALPGLIEHWEPTGESEYRLDDGRRIDVHRDGRMEIVDTGVTLEPQGVRH
jgi:hypothetical protein